VACSLCVKKNLEQCADRMGLENPVLLLAEMIGMDVAFNADDKGFITSMADMNVCECVKKEKNDREATRPDSASADGGNSDNNTDNNGVQGKETK